MVVAVVVMVAAVDSEAVDDLITRAVDFFFLAKERNPAKGSSNRRQRKTKDVETMREHFTRMQDADQTMQGEEASAMTQPRIIQPPTSVAQPFVVPDGYGLVEFTDFKYWANKGDNIEVAIRWGSATAWFIGVMTGKSSSTKDNYKNFWKVKYHRTDNIECFNSQPTYVIAQFPIGHDRGGWHPSQSHYDITWEKVVRKFQYPHNLIQKTYGRSAGSEWVGVKKLN